MDTEALEVSVVTHEAELKALLSAVDFFESHMFVIDDEEELEFEALEQSLLDEVQHASDTRH
jgi:hypothetical protein